MKNSNDTIGNRARDLPVCSAVAQPFTPLLARLISGRLTVRGPRINDFPVRHRQALCQLFMKD